MVEVITHVDLLQLTHPGKNQLPRSVQLLEHRDIFDSIIHVLTPASLSIRFGRCTAQNSGTSPDGLYAG